MQRSPPDQRKQKYSESSESEASTKGGPITRKTAIEKAQMKAKLTKPKKDLQPNDGVEDHWGIQLKEEIMEMLTGWKEEQDACLKKLHDEIKEVRKQNKHIQATNKEIEKSVEFITKQHDEVLQKIKCLEKVRKESDLKISVLEDKVEELQRALKTSVMEIRNIPRIEPEAKKELTKIVMDTGIALGTELQMSDIKDVYRSNNKTTNSAIIVELNTPLLKHNILNNAKKYNKQNPDNKLDSAAIGLKLRSDSEDEAPFLKIMARSTVYNAGETKAIFCKRKHIAEPIEWFSPSGKKVDVRSSKNARVFVEKRTGDNEEYLVPLIIQFIKISDSGNWTCKAGEFSDHIDIIVGEKVNLPERNVTMEGQEGKTVRLTCDARGFPTPVIVWYKENTQIPDDSRKYIVRPDNSLEIKKLDHTDIGTYICKVRQKAISYYTDKTVHLSVQHKPILYNSDTQTIYTKYKTEEIYAILNETKNITCSAIANPPPTYRWYRRNDGFDDGPIEDPDTVMTSEDGTNSVLVLRMRDETYLGEYKCTATNTKGAESIVFHVSIGTKPDPPDFASVAAINVTELVFNVSCSTCIMQTPEDESPNPQNLTVLGYSFQLVPVKVNYPPDWDAASEILVDVTDPDDTLFTVGPLSNGTAYHVRVRTRNAAGFSEWFELAETPKTANDALRMTFSLLLVIAAFVFTLCYK